MINAKEKYRIRITRLLEDGSEVPFGEGECGKAIDCNGFFVTGMTAATGGFYSSTFIHDCAIADIAMAIKNNNTLNAAATFAQAHAIKETMEKLVAAGFAGGGYTERRFGQRAVA